MYISHALTVSNSIINKNRSSGYGGGIWVSGVTILLNNSILMNSALNASAVYYSKGVNKDFKSNTIMGNITTEPSQTYSIYVANGSHPLFNNNNLFYNTATYELWNNNSQGTTDINARYNLWGTTNDSIISSKIYDYFDDPTKSIVNYSPFLNIPDTSAPVSPPSGLTFIQQSGKIILNWSSNPETDVAGYKVYYDTAQGYIYAHCVDVGNKTTDTITGIPSGTYYFAVTAYDIHMDSVNDQIEGHESWFSEAKSVDITDVSNETNNILPNQVVLRQNYPNPFNPITKIQYSIPSSQFVTLKVYDILGREVVTLVNERKGPGSYEVNFGGDNLPKGIYFYRIQAGIYSETKKLILLR